MNQWKNFTKGFFKDNPVFVMLLGMCPTLGVTSSAVNGLGMGLATTFVLVMSNIVVALVKDFIPDKVRIPAFIVIIASFVTIVEMVMQAYIPALFEALGLFIPLIVVNCLVLGRAEAFASKNAVGSSIIDGLGMGLGFLKKSIIPSY
jgi:electron transport complex protein RnfE